MASIYILKCIDGSYYVGSTANLESRLLKHKLGGVKFTKPRLPVSLIYQEDYKTKSDAQTREYQIKSWKKRKNIENLIKRAAFV